MITTPTIRALMLLVWGAANVSCASDSLRRLHTTTDEFHQNAAAKVDILWVVDNSASMSQEQTGLGESFEVFINNLLASGVDYHIGVISTDVAQGGELHHGTGFPPVIDRNTSDAVAAFLANVRVGTDGSAQEEGFRAATMALGRNAEQWTPGDPDPVTVPNEGFLRRGYCLGGMCEGTDQTCGIHSECDRAALFIIFVSDEDDSSFGPVNYYWRLFKSYYGPGNEPQIKVSAIVGDPPVDNSDATDDGGCYNEGRGSAGWGRRYIELVLQSGGTTAATNAAQGIVTSICEEFNDSLTALSINAAGLASKFRLASRLVPSAEILCPPLPPQALCVRVNGEAVAPDESGGRNGWTFDPGENAVVFGVNVLPPPQASITVEYQGADKLEGADQ